MYCLPGIKIKNNIDHSAYPFTPFHNVCGYNFMFFWMIAGRVRPACFFCIFSQLIFDINICLTNDNIVQFEMEQMRIDKICDFDWKFLIFQRTRHFFSGPISYFQCKHKWNVVSTKCLISCVWLWLWLRCLLVRNTWWNEYIQRMFGAFSVNCQRHLARGCTMLKWCF